MNSASVRELHNGTSAILDEVHAKQRSVLVTRRGRPVAAIVPLDPDEFEDFVLSHAPAFVGSLRKAEREVERGETVPLADVIAEFESEHGPLDAAA